MLKRDTELVDAKELREALGEHLTDWTLAKFRKRKMIPYVPLGHRTYLYNVERVRVALARLEVKEVV